MKAKDLMCPQCKAPSIERIGLKRFFLCILLIVVAVIFSKGLRFAGSREVVMNSEKYKILISLNELNGKVPMTFPYDQVVYPDYFKWGAGIYLLNLLLGIYFFVLVVKLINGNRKCKCCKHIFKA